MHFPVLLALYALVSSWMTELAPGRDHSELALAIAENALASPLFRESGYPVKTAALVTAVAYRESGFRNDAVGDNGHSVCAMQIYDGPRELLADPDACIARGIAMLRESIRYDSRHPVAFYARGPRYESDEARRISNDRMAIAKRLAQPSK